MKVILSDWDKDWEVECKKVKIDFFNKKITMFTSEGEIVEDLVCIDEIIE